MLRFTVPRNVNSDPSGYTFLGNVSLDTYNVDNEIIIIDFIYNEWFDATFCAALGALVEQIKSQGNKVHIINVAPDVNDVFKKNGFCSVINSGIVVENSHSAVYYRKFAFLDTEGFQQYIDNQLISHSSFPVMSEQLRVKIIKNILEIFDNAHFHGESEHVYTCGQYYPVTGMLKFAIADIGVTIRAKVNRYFKSGRSIGGPEAIAWAVKKGNTTKDVPAGIPGGLGLGLIREFLTMNGGKINILSSNGFWSEDKGKEMQYDLGKPRFMGTIVTIEFNLKDDKSYKLVSEVSETDIF